MGFLITAVLFYFDVNRLGAAPITIIQETIWVRYFKKDGLALVLALGMTSGKLVCCIEIPIGNQRTKLNDRTNVNSHSYPHSLNIHHLGGISGAGDISTAEHTATVWIRHALYCVLDHLYDRMGDEHYFFDAAGETKGRRRHNDQDHNPLESQADSSWLEGSLWVLNHALDTADHQLLGRCQLESFHASGQVR